MGRYVYRAEHKQAGVVAMVQCCSAESVDDQQQELGCGCVVGKA